MSIYAREQAKKDAVNCPVCYRVLSAVRDLKKSKNINNAEALNKYCMVQGLSTEDQQFCYNIDSMKADIVRLLDLQADDKRICAKVYRVNPHFCTVTSNQSASNKSFRGGNDRTNNEMSGSGSGNKRKFADSVETNNSGESYIHPSHLRYKRGLIYS